MAARRGVIHKNRGRIRAKTPDAEDEHESNFAPLAKECIQLRFVDLPKKTGPDTVGGSKIQPDIRRPCASDPHAEKITGQRGR